MHFFDHLATGRGDDETHSFTCPCERTNGSGSEITGDVQRVSLPQILEAHGEHEGEAELSRGNRELAHRRVVRTVAPLRWIGANGRRAVLDGSAQLLTPSWP